jgi:hypothetical protein
VRSGAPLAASAITAAAISTLSVFTSSNGSNRADRFAAEAAIVAWSTHLHDQLWASGPDEG